MISTSVTESMRPPDSSRAATAPFQEAGLPMRMAEAIVSGFAIGAPLLFTLPLFMFTKQLFRAKRRALAVYRERVTDHSRRVENRWLTSPKASQAADEEIRQLAELATLGTMFSRIEQMRVVPFDLRSFTQLLGSTLGSIATLLPLLHVKGELASAVDALGKLLGHLGGV